SSRFPSGDPLDVCLDCLALVVDPAMRPRLFDHGGEIILPRRVFLDARPSAQRILEDPRRSWFGQFGFSRDRFANRLEPVGVAFDDKLEYAEIVAVLEQ